MSFLAPTAVAIACLSSFTGVSQIARERPDPALKVAKNQFGIMPGKNIVSMIAR